ncbi:DUF4062 domain-containing protein [Nocardia niwae]|uniref:DUF4062 domain-containing protein n=1 Tax=Nocardia niwae TaxID=626084 RepID=UPI0033CDD167
MAERELRVFVSSTFRDMQGERDHLVKVVFPQLRKLAAARGVSWSEVDLRWGITDEATAEGRVLPICLAEVERCAPYFIGLLGDRYGWIPQDVGPLAAERPWVLDRSDRSVTELEILQGLQAGGPGVGGRHFYFRAPHSAAPDSPLSAVESVDRQGRLEQLEERIREAAASGRCRLREGYRDPAELGSWVLEDFTRLIDSLFPAAEASKDRFDDAGWDQRRRLTEVYIARDRDFARLDAHFNGSGPPLVVCGDSGLGKTALLANWLSHRQRRDPERPALGYFIGVTSAITTPAQLLRELMVELRRRHSIAEEVPFGLPQLQAAFPRFLEQAAAGGSLAVVIDAVNQLEGGEDLTWIPARTDPRVRLVVSTTPGPILDALDPSWPRLTVQPLDTAERRALVVRLLAAHRRELDHARLERIVAAEQSAVPLFTCSMLDELRQFGDHDRLDEMIERYLSVQDAAALFDLIIQRWADDFGAAVVDSALAVLACAAAGMSPAELLDLLGEGAQPLPAAHWVPFYLAAEPLLANRSGLLSFLHESLAAAVHRRVLATPERERSVRTRIGDYFQAQPSFLDQARTAPNLRKAQELMAQRLQSGDRQRSLATLCDLDYIEVKIGARLAPQLLAEYAAAEVAFGPDGHTMEFARFVSRSLPDLIHDPAGTFQVAANEPDSSAVAAAAGRRWAARQERRLWLQHLNKDTASPQFGLTYDGHRKPGEGGGGSSNWITACRHSPDGRWIASVDYEGSLHVRDAETGALRRIINGEKSGNAECAWAPDSRHLVVVGGGSPMVLDALTGQRVAVLRGRAGLSARSCDWSADGRRIVTGGGNFDYSGETARDRYRRQVVIWDTGDWSTHHAVVGHENEVSCVRFAADSATVVSGDSGYRSDLNSLAVWDRETGAELARRPCAGEITAIACPARGTTVWTEMHGNLSGTVNLARGELSQVEWTTPVPSPTSVAMSADGRWVAVGSRDQSLYVLNAATGAIRVTLAGHGSWVEACDASPTRPVFITGSRDCTVRTWPLPPTETGSASHAPRHELQVSVGVFSPDGSLFVSGGDSDEHSDPTGSVQLWDARTGAHRAQLLAGHNGITACAFVDDFHIVVSTDGGYARGPQVLDIDVHSGVTAVRLDRYFPPKWKVDRRRRLIFVPAVGDYARANEARLVRLDDGWKVERTKGRGGCVISESAGLVATGDDAGRVIVHELGRASSSSRQKIPRQRRFTRWGPAFQTGVASLASSTDMRYLAAVSDGRLSSGGEMHRELRCWDLAEGKSALYIPEGDLRAPLFSADSFVVTRGGDVLVFDLPTFRPRATLRGHGFHVTGSAVVPGTPWLATVSLDQTLRLWNLRTLRPERTFPLRGRGTVLAVSPTQPVLAAGDELGIVYLLAIRTQPDEQQA